jgi:PAS domain S-box-containing protein
VKSHWADNKTAQNAVGSDGMFRMLAENSTDIIWVLDIKTLKLTYVSPSVLNIRGYTSDEVIQMPLENIMTPESYSRALLEIQDALKLDELQKIDPDHIFLFEFDEYRKDSSIISSEARMRFVRDSGGIPIEIYGITRDVTERKHMETALQVEHDLFSAVFKSAPYIMMLVNRDGTVANINHKGVEFSQKSKSDILNLPFGQVLNCVNAFDGLECGKSAPCAQCPVLDRVGNTFKTGEASYEQEGRLGVIGDARKVYLDLLISTALVKTKDGMCVLVTIADITERKQVEEELRESEMRFSALFDSSPVPVIELDCSIINNRFNELRNLGVKNIREYFDTNPEEVAAFTSLVKVTNVNQTSVVFFGAGSKEGVIAGMPDYFLSQSPTAYKEELIALAEGSVRFENETAVHLVMRGDLTVFHILSVVPGYEQSLERVLVSFIDVTQQAEMYNREHNIANILQRALLPSRIPQIPGCDISVEYHTHKHIQLLKNNY